MRHPHKCRNIGQNGNDGKRHGKDKNRIECRTISEYPAEKSTEAGQYDPFGTLHKPHLALQPQSFGSRPDITYHDRPDKGNKRDDSPRHIPLQDKEKEYSEKGKQLAVPVEYRIIKRTETGNHISKTRNTSVEHIEQAGKKYDTSS